MLAICGLVRMGRSQVRNDSQSGMAARVYTGLCISGELSSHYLL
jgi:hypothetical protein